MTEATSPSDRFAAGEFRIGSVLNRTWWVFSRNFPAFFAVTAIASVPDALLSNAGQSRSLAILGVFVSDVMRRLSQAAVLYGAFQDMRGNRVSLTQSFQVGLRRFFPIVGLAISAAFVTMLASILLVIPGVIVFMMLFVATPACVVEQLGPFDSMERSSQLTRGHRWKIFGMLLLLILPAIIVAGAFELIAELADGGFIVSVTCELIWSGILGAFYTVLVIATYHDLRVVKEGVDTAQISAVFE
jgi:hypothetical protein